LYIDSSQRVGIGTTGPNAALDVRSASTWIGDGTTDAFLQFNQSATAANRWHIGTGSSNALIFYKGTYGSGSETARIDSSGRLLVGTSTANANGGILQLTSGITFPATAVAATDVNTLDDYEEGTWTPTQGAGLTVVGTFSSNGHYTKIGRQVTVQGYVAGSTSVAAATSSIICAGLPFTAKAAALAQCVGSAANTTTNALINVLVNQSTSDVYAVTAMAATATIFFSVSYLT
jgi:hypothetical protein